nr:MAG TPA: hypothetical protein [Caudoviricetes sp.]
MHIRKPSDHFQFLPAPNIRSDTVFFHFSVKLKKYFLNDKKTSRKILYIELQHLIVIIQFNDVHHKLLYFIIILLYFKKK